MEDLKNIKEEIPVLTGPGAIFIALILVALLFTSNLTRNLLTNWEVIAALILIAIPSSVLFVQLYHAFHILYDVKKRNLGRDYQHYSRCKYQITSMIDYLAFENDKTEKQWSVIYRKAQGKNLFGSLSLASLFFVVIYIITVFTVGNFVENVYNPINWAGVVFTSGIGLTLAAIFWMVHNELDGVIGIFDRELITQVKMPLDSWIEREPLIMKDENIGSSEEQKQT